MVRSHLKLLRPLSSFSYLSMNPVERCLLTQNSFGIIRNSGMVVTCVVKFKTYLNAGLRGGVVVKALRYKPAGRGFDSRWCHWNFSVT